MKTVFNRKDIDFSKEPMFFGEDNSVQRYDVFKYPVFDKLNQKMIGYFWRPEEVSLQKDRGDYAEFRPEQKHIFTSNLKYQTLLDSVQGRGPSLAFLPYVSSPELEGCIVTWDFFETIHSRSYTHIMKNVYADPSEVFDTILNDKEILKRAVSVTENYDRFYKTAEDYFVKGKGDIKDVKKQLYLAMVNVNILEGLRFYVSFACTFAFGEAQLMEGSAKIISLIARDEAEHLALSTHIIKNWQKGDDKEMQKIYVEWITNKRMKAIGFDPLYNHPASQNPLPWTQHWLSSTALQVAPQETEVESYVVGGIKQDVTDDTFKGFKL